MKHGKFIHLDDLEKDRWLGAESKTPLRAKRWTREILARHLKVKEVRGRFAWEGGSV